MVSPVSKNSSRNRNPTKHCTHCQPISAVSIGAQAISRNKIIVGWSTIRETHPYADAVPSDHRLLRNFWTRAQVDIDLPGLFVFLGSSKR